jgi:hypothetical protein
MTRSTPARSAAEAKLRAKLQVVFGAAASALLPVDEIIRGRDAAHRLRGEVGIAQVARDDFHAFRPREALQPRRVAHETADAVAGVQQARRQPSAHIAGRAGDEDEFFGHVI